MSKKFAAFAFVTLAALVSVAPAAALDAPVVIRVYEPYSDDERQPHVDLDLGEPGPGPGDMFLRRETLFNSQRQFGKARGARVGQVDIQVTLFTDGARVVATISFADGKLEVGGFAPMARTTSNPVLGGTGNYANARGTIEVTNLRDRSKIVLRLFPVQ